MVTIYTDPGGATVTWYDDAHPPTEPGIYYWETCDEHGNPRPGLYLWDKDKHAEFPRPCQQLFKLFGPIRGAMQEWPTVPDETDLSKDM